MSQGIGDQGAGAGGVSRRAALKVLGTAAAGVAAGCGPDGGGGANGARDGSRNAGANPAPPPAAAAARTFFTPHERETAAALADYVIPRDERSGSAGDAGVPAWMDAFLAHPDTTDDLRRQVRGGLAWLDAESGRRFGGATFVRATDAQRRQLLDAIAYPARARPEVSQGVAFFNRFRDLTASGFFTSRLGQEDLRYMGNVAVPVWNGCPPEAMQRLGVSEAVMATRVPPQTGARRA